MMTRVRWFEDISLTDLPSVGGKNASLGEMTSRLRAAGVRVPGGFAVTAGAFREFVDVNGLRPEMEGLLSDWEKGRRTLPAAGRLLRGLLLKGRFPEGLETEVRQAYGELRRRSGDARRGYRAARCASVAPYRGEHCARRRLL